MDIMEIMSTLSSGARLPSQLYEIRRISSPSPYAALGMFGTTDVDAGVQPCATAGALLAPTGGVRAIM